MDRICNEALLRKVTTPRAAAAHIKNGMTVGFSGFTVIGYPKVLPVELARRAEEGEELGITVITGGNVGDQLDGVLARSGVMKRRYGFQGNRDLRALANADRIQYVDTHVSHGPYLIKNGYLGKIDVAVIEVAAIRADGSLVLPFSVGIDDTLVKYAEKLILEVNEAIPLEVEGMHDILTLERAPHTQAIEIFKPDDRVGSPYLACDPDKVAAVILTNCEDTNQDLPAPTPDMEAIASHIVKFLQSEVAAGRLPNPLPPMQSGVGGVANAVLSALARSELEHLSVYTEVMQDAVVELIDAGKVACASGTALTISPSARERFYAHIDDYKGKIILRPQELSNAPEVIRRLSIIAMNTAIEMDIYGNVNSTHIMGSSMMNGIGGSGDFSRNAAITIFSAPSTAKGGKISSVVPMVSHVDHTEHEVMVLVTEQGFADLRGLSPKERAVKIIQNCAHPDFKDALMDYFERACEGNPSHTPHILNEALSWHIRFQKTGSMSV